MGRQEQTQLQQDTQAQHASSMQDVALMFRDQFGTILNQVERALYALHLMEESEFKFHGYSAQRMVEGQPEFIALKLALSYRNFANYHEDMVDQYASDAAGLQKTLGEALPQTAFKANADDLLERLGKIGDDDRDKEVKQLLKQVLTNLIRDKYDRLDADLVAKIKALQTGPRVQPNPQVDQTEMLNRVHNIQQNEQEIADYMSRNKGQPAPSSAYQPATRDSCLNKRSTSHYVGKRRPEPKVESTHTPHSFKDSNKKLSPETDFTKGAVVKENLAHCTYDKSLNKLQKSGGTQMKSTTKTLKANCAEQTKKQYSQNTQKNSTVNSQSKAFGKKVTEAHTQVRQKEQNSSRKMAATSYLHQQIPKKASEVLKLPEIPNSMAKSTNVTPKQSSQKKTQQSKLGTTEKIQIMAGRTQSNLKPSSTFTNQQPSRTQQSKDVAVLQEETQPQPARYKIGFDPKSTKIRTNKKGAPAFP